MFIFTQAKTRYKKALEKDPDGTRMFIASHAPSAGSEGARRIRHDTSALGAISLSGIKKRKLAATDETLHLNWLDFRERMMMLGYRKPRKLDQLWEEAMDGKRLGYTPCMHNGAQALLRDSPHTVSKERSMEQQVQRRREGSGFGSKQLRMQDGDVADIDPCSALPPDSASEDDAVDDDEAMDGDPLCGEECEESEEAGDFEPDVPMTDEQAAALEESASMAPPPPALSLASLAPFRRRMPSSFGGGGSGEATPVKPVASSTVPVGVALPRRVRGKVSSKMFYTAGAPDGNISISGRSQGTGAKSLRGAPSPTVEQPPQEETYEESKALVMSYGAVIADPCDFVEALRIARLLAKHILQNYKVDVPQHQQPTIFQNVKRTKNKTI